MSAATDIRPGGPGAQASSREPVHTISLLVQDRPGVLVRVALVFARRGYNIESLVVSPGAAGGFSRMTIACSGDPETLEQIIKQLNKVIEVLKVIDLTETDFVERETALIKINAKSEHRDEAIRICEIFRAKIVDSTPQTYSIEITGDADKIRAIINLLQPLGIKDMVRTGRVAIAREAVRPAAHRELRAVKA